MGILQERPHVNGPPYRNIIVDTKMLFRTYKNAFYIRWESEFDITSNTSYYHVIKDGEISFESLSSGVRNLVRKCFKNCEISIVDFQYIVDRGGYEVYLSEHRRYNRNGHASSAKTKEQWSEGMAEAAQNGQELWAVIHEEHIVAYSICMKKAEHVDLVTWKVDYEKYKHFYPSYGLIYKMLEHHLSFEDVKFVDDGGRSLTEHSNVQIFLMQKFGFRKAYTKLNAKFRWYLLPILKMIAPFEKYIRHSNLRSLVRLYKWSR